MSTNNGRETLEQAGAYRIDELELISSSGVRADKFAKKVMNFQIHESIFTSNLSGGVLITDTDNLPMNMPITGQDYFKIKLSTPGVEEKPIFDHVFCVNQLVNRGDISTGAQGYMLLFNSPETLLNERVKVKRSYTDTTSNIIESVLRNNLKSQKDIILEETNGVRKFVCPNLKPYLFLKHLKRESISKSGSPNYLFFENSRGYSFVTTDYLYEQPKKIDLQSSDKVLLPHSGRDVEQDLKNIIAEQIDSTPDSMVISRNGMLSAKHFVYNYFEKSYDIGVFNYFDEFDRHARLSENPLFIKSVIDDEGHDIGSFSDAHVTLHPTSKSGANDGRYTGEFADNRSERWLSTQRSKIIELADANTMQIKIYGRADIAVGDKINIKKPISGKTHDKGEFDNVYEGDFLVTHLTHDFVVNSADSEQQHFISLSITQDSTPHNYKIVGETLEPKKGNNITTKV